MVLILKFRVDNILVHQAPTKTAISTSQSPTNATSTKAAFPASSAYISSLSSRSLAALANQPPSEVCVCIRYGHKLSSSDYHELPSYNSSNSASGTPVKNTNVPVDSNKIYINQELILMGDFSESSQVLVDLYCRQKGSTATVLAATASLTYDALLAQQKSKGLPKLTIKLLPPFEVSRDSETESHVSSAFVSFESVEMLDVTSKLPKDLIKPISADIFHIFDEKVTNSDMSMESLQSSGIWSQQTKTAILSAFEAMVQAYDAHKQKNAELMARVEEMHVAVSKAHQAQLKLEEVQRSYDQYRLSQPLKENLVSKEEFELLSMQLKAKDQLIESLRADNDKLRVAVEIVDGKSKSDGKKTSKSSIFGGNSDELLKSEIAKLRAELSDSKATKLSMESAITSLQESLKRKDAQVAELKATIDSSYHKISDLNDKLLKAPSDEDYHNYRLNGETFWALLDVEMKITTSFTDLHRLFSDETYERDIQEIREYASEKGGRMTTIAEQRDELERVVIDLTRKLEAANRNERATSVATNDLGFDPFSSNAHPIDQWSNFTPSHEIMKDKPSADSIAALQTELNGCKLLIEEQNNKLSQAEVYIKYQDDTIAAMNTEINDLKVQASIFNPIEKSTSKSAQSEVKQLELRLQKAADYVKQQNSRIAALEAEIASNSASSPASGTDSQEMERLKELNAKYEEKLKQAAEYVSYQQEQYSTLEGEFRAYRTAKEAAAPQSKSSTQSKDQTNDYKREIESLKDQIRANEEKLKQGAEYVKYLQEQHAIAEQELLKYSSDNSNPAISLELEKKSDLVAKLQEEIKQLQNQVRKMENDDKDWKDVVNDLQMRLDEALETYSQLKSVHEGIEIELDSHKEAVKAYEVKLKQAAEFVQYQKDQLSSLEEEYQQYKSSTSAHNEEAMREYVQDLQKRHEDEVRQLDKTYQDKINQGLEYMKELQEQNKIAESELQRLRDVESDKDKLEETLGEHLKDLEDEVNELNGQIERLKEDYKAKQIECEDLLVQNKQYEEKLSQAKMYVDYIQNEYETLRSEYESKNTVNSDQNLIDLQETIRNYEQKLEQGAEYVKYLQEQHALAEKELESYRAKASIVSPTKDSNANPAKVKNLEDQLHEKEVLVQRLQSQNQKLGEELARLQELERENENIDEKLAFYLKDCNQQIDDLKQELASSQELVSQYEGKLTKAAEYVGYLHDRQSELTNEIETLKANSSRSSRPIDSSNDNLQKTIDELIERQEDGLRVLREREQTINALNDRLKELQGQLDKKAANSEEKGLLNSQLKAMNSKIDELRLENDALLQQLIDVKMKNALLQEQVDKEKRRAAMAHNQLQESMRRVPNISTGATKR